MSEENKGFAVSDRRHFTPAGETRETVEARDPGTVDARSETTGATAGEEKSPASPHSGEDLPADLAGLIVSLAAQASLLLADRKGGADLKGARECIGLLEMLREKTQGNRTASEDQILEGVLYELRMGYLETTRGGR